MVNGRTLVDVDVHSAKIVAAVLDVEAGEVRCFRLPGEVWEMAAFNSGLARARARDLWGLSERYGLARELKRRRVACVVCAPGKIPRAAGEQVKTDRRDTEHLARLLLAASCIRVRFRVRRRRRCATWCAREDVRVDLMRARHRVSKLRSPVGRRSSGALALRWHRSGQAIR